MFLKLSLVSVASLAGLLELVSADTSPVDAACAALRNRFPTRTYSPNSISYSIADSRYFSRDSSLGPACIVAPASTAEMAQTVLELTAAGVPFAVRGGGHMPIKGAAGIDDSGILISTAKLDQLALAADSQSVVVGAGNRWDNVYAYLELHGLSAVGGRVGDVGVAGFLLGGGISFFGSEHGFASSNVVRYEVVLANGTVANATASANADLFWALRGGGNSFAIVTAFELRTLPVSAVMVGEAQYGGGSAVGKAFLDSVYSFAVNGALDSRAAITPVALLEPLLGADTPISYSSFLFYDGHKLNPPALANFTGANALAGVPGALPLPLSNTFSHRSLHAWSVETGLITLATTVFNARFHVLAVRADRAVLAAIHDTFFSVARTRVGHIAGWTVSLAFQPITQSFIETNRGAAGVAGDPMGIDATRAPYVWIDVVLMFINAEEADEVDAFLVEAMAAVNAAVAALTDQGHDVATPYLYLNDANGNQPVFQGYDAANLARLKSIRDQYDPLGIYTSQMPGGFKVAAA